MSDRDHRQGASKRCGAIWVLIRPVLQSSVWHFPSTPAPSSLLTWTLLDAQLPTRLSSILCWHRQAALSLIRLMNSCWAVFPTAIVIHARALIYAYSAYIHWVKVSHSEAVKCLSVCTFWHVLTFSCLWELLTADSLSVHYPLIRWIDFGVCWQDKCVLFFPCLFAIKLNRYITFHSELDKGPYKIIVVYLGHLEKKEGYVSSLKSLVYFKNCNCLSTEQLHFHIIIHISKREKCPIKW